ncbi:hypothetical protein [Actinomadura sp. WMMA1423]|uniref:hypothetical protein n=1 Tax=Actinomadura sp. WMMA1423 TaxID=2591108 RepID=UPI001146A922|nr:hypothetical protein [Actinomadura sp. WMMA1423]
MSRSFTDAQRVRPDPASMKAALRKYGWDFWLSFLMVRHKARITAASRRPDLVPEKLWEVTARAPIFDVALVQLGATWWEHPDMYDRGVIDHVHWVVDQIVEVTRGIRMGDVLGPAAIVRQQTERWTINIAGHHGLTQSENESRADYIGRVWQEIPSCQIDVGQAWARLSQWLHGRGDVLDAIAWDIESSDPLRGSVTVPDSTVKAAELYAELLDLALYPASGVGCLVARDRKRTDLQVYLTARPKLRLQPDLGPNALRALRPLDFSTVVAPDMQKIAQDARTYRREVAQRSSAAHLQRGLAAGTVERAILERRGRAVDGALRAFEQTHEKLGEDFSPAGLATRIFRFIAISEASHVVAEWSSGAERTALLVAASAARSAWRFWLEDTDISLVCMRTVLEQTCRARAWRLRPLKAANLENAPGLVSPSRWIDLAGWRRAGVLNRSMGEFSHLELRSRRSGARQLLSEMQDPETEESLRLYLGRGAALDNVFRLLAFEVIARLQAAGNELAESFRQTITLVDEATHEAEVEQLLNLGLGLRGFDFGEPDFKTPDPRHP